MADRQADIITPALLLGGAAWLISKYVGNVAKQNRYYGDLRILIGKADIRKGVLLIQLNIQNPNSENALIRSIVGDAYVNGTKVGNVSSFKVINVRGNNETSVVLNIKIKALNLSAALLRLLQMKSQILIQFLGTANVNNKTVPFDMKYAVL